MHITNAVFIKFFIFLKCLGKLQIYWRVSECFSLMLFLAKWIADHFLSKSLATSLHTTFECSSNLTSYKYIHILCNMYLSILKGICCIFCLCS